MSEGTDLWRRLMGKSYATEKLTAIARKHLAPAPWMIDFNTGKIGSERYEAVMQWLTGSLGPEIDLIRGVQGKWRVGTVTWDGMSYIGFAEKQDMETFLREWRESSER